VGNFKRFQALFALRFHPSESRQQAPTETVFWFGRDDLVVWSSNRSGFDFLDDPRREDTLTLLGSRPPRAALTTTDLLINSPAFTDSKSVRTPVPRLIFAVAIYPSRLKVETRLSTSRRFLVQDRRQSDMADITANPEVDVVVAGLWMNDSLDDGVLVEVAANQIADVTLHPRLKVGVRGRAEVDDEVREMSPPVEAAIERRRDLAAVNVPVGGTERIDADVRHLRAILANSVAGAAGADRGRRYFVRADRIVGWLGYNTHGSFVARRECSMIAGPHYFIRSTSFLSQFRTVRVTTAIRTHGIRTERGKKGTKSTRWTWLSRRATTRKPCLFRHFCTL
jgi:hypothetical protein